MNEKQKDANVIHNLFAEFCYADDLGVIKSKITEYVGTVRQEARAAAFRDAIEIVDRLVCDPKFDGNWRNGYGQAQNDMQDALEAAANSVQKDSEGEGVEDDAKR